VAELHLARRWAPCARASSDSPAAAGLATNAGTFGGGGGGGVPISTSMTHFPRCRRSVTSGELRDAAMTEDSAPVVVRVLHQAHLVPATPSIS
jgi:hypothetical protein